MSGYGLLAKNIGILTVANFGTKFLSFLLVPLYTSVLSTGDYGSYDLVLNTVGLLIPLLTQNILDGVLRFSIDEDCDRESVIGIGLKYFFIATGIVAVALAVNYVLGISRLIADLSVLVLLVFATQALSQILLYYARGVNRFADVAVSSVLCSAVVIAANIVFLIPLHLGLTGYFLANVIGPVLQIAYLAVRLKLHGAKVINADKKLERDMLAYSRPLVTNSVAWWVNNVSDRFVVTFFCGVAANGVYSVASKIPSILSIFQTIIGQAWTVSAVGEFDPEDKKGFFSDVYAVYNSLMVLLCSAIIVLDIPLAHFLYANDFFEAWRYVPFLTIAIVFGALAGYVGGILAAVKDSKEFARSTVVGALTNVLLNVLTVPFIGPLGSAIATAVCYWVTWVLRMRVCSKYIHLRLQRARNNVSYIVLVAQGLLLLVLFGNPVACYSIEMACFLLLLLMYRKDLMRITSRVKTKIRG